MTALDTNTSTPATTGEPAESTPRTREQSRSAPRRVLIIAACAVVAIVTAYAVFQLFEGPVADAWYANRQHQLAPRATTLQANPGAGDPIAIMQIPRLGLSLVVAQGDSPQQLRSGPGHRIGTVRPGEIGNSVVVGHRAGWGGPLRDLDLLKPGDHIVLQVAGPPPDFVPVNGVFEVKSLRSARADDVTVFAPSTDRRVTIVTGTGGQFSDRRLVLTAVSGQEGKLLAPAVDLAASTPAGSLWWNSYVLLAVVGLGAAALTFGALRRRYRPATLAAVVAPLVLLGLLGLLLNVDAALPPLR